jgi:hypothetical protein
MARPVLEAFNDKFIDGLIFCRMAYAHFDEIARSPGGDQILRKRERPEKKLLEEIFPICRYIQTFYGPDQYISVRWVDGAQPFDAKVETTGAMVDHGMWPKHGTLEVTQAVHKNEYLMRELLITKGGGFGLDGISVSKTKSGEREIKSEPVCYTNQSYIDDMCLIIRNAISAKVAKLSNGDYPDDTTLIVDCSLMTLFLQSEWDTLISKVKKDLPPHEFVRIFLTSSSGGYFTTL